MATTPKPISGLTSAAAARVVLWQSREFVMVPGNAMGLQASLPAGTNGMHLELVAGVPTWVEPAELFVAAGTFGGASEDINLSAFIARGFKYFKIMWSAWTPSTSNAMLTMQFSTNAGSSFITTGYGGQLIYALGSAPTVAAGAANSTTFVQLAHGAPTSADSSHGFAEVNLGSSAAEWYFCSKSVIVGPNHGMLTGGGQLNSANVNAIRLAPNTGNSGAGKYTIHALKDF